MYPIWLQLKQRFERKEASSEGVRLINQILGAKSLSRSLSPARFDWRPHLLKLLTSPPPSIFTVVLLKFTFPPPSRTNRGFRFSPTAAAMASAAILFSDNQPAKQLTVGGGAAEEHLFKDGSFTMHAPCDFLQH